jgi:hypothetical protein
VVENSVSGTAQNKDFFKIKFTVPRDYIKPSYTFFDQLDYINSQRSPQHEILMFIPTGGDPGP